MELVGVWEELESSVGGSLELRGSLGKTFEGRPKGQPEGDAKETIRKLKAALRKPKDSPQETPKAALRKP